MRIPSNVDFSTVISLRTQALANKNGKTPKKNDSWNEPWRIKNSDNMETKIKVGLSTIGAPNVVVERVQMAET